ncbi:peptidase S8/S53 domain-containing protein [Thelonectria olida]|uniref:tripeptidyl-peptidase II n=1 Tax=Thelonectria olida TaxID=1576542 RepID=A0A9P9AJS9_9HYPO|nr:peptidase S8/S53 domain-containing protein [Thelonectria olida]
MASKLIRCGALLLGTLATLAAGIPVVVESLDQPPVGWEEVSSASPDKLIKLSIGMQPESHETFERTLYEISDPSHRKYGRHLSREAAKALLNPRKEATEAVKRWLTDAGVPDNQVRDDGQWIHVRTTVGQAEGLLTTRFGVFARDDELVVRTREYSVPKEIRNHITTIQPTTIFHTLKKARGTKSASQDLEQRASVEERGHYGGGGSSVDLAQCQTKVTPPCLRKLYKMPTKNFPDAHKQALFGIAGFNYQAAQYDQLEEFLDRFDPIQEGRNFSVALVNSGTNPQGAYPGGEANPNTQYALSMSGEVPVRFYSVGGENHNFIPDLDLFDNQEAWVEPYLEFTSYLVNLESKKLPNVISMSYSVNEQHLTKAYAKQVCNMFGVLGARGVSVVVAAGNRGPGRGCMSNDGKNTTKFIPNFPPTCPYVTVVGGTDNYASERALTASSGGFSEYWSRPWWQDNAVKPYLKKYGKEWKGYFNPEGRAYPDVAALATNYQVMNHDVVESINGTSLATPVFGSVIAYLNNERLRKGKSPLGFLNPWIYTIGYTGLKDITEGKSTGCPGTSYWGLPSPVIPNAGWKAAKGWDPVTGWGTPLYDRLRNLVV